MKTKKCSNCKKNKKLSEFCKASRSKDGHGCECKSCQSERNKKFIAKQKTKKHRAKMYLSKRYGLTLDDYNLMLQEQDGCCAMCGRHWTNFSKRLHVDHNHKTGKVRGLLCASCNAKLGIIEDEQFFKMAQEYLNNGSDIK